ncbi:MAG: 50S ribosome-binding GTPase [Planctomycetaceae bacterium]|nr:50S ribosome-binding GTPase [Planctomycetaceae bacterium]
MRLVDPARVAIVGLPNSGKSTLSNALLGREASIVSPEAGTTRDAVSARIDLAGLVVEWFDLPGMRATGDEVEASAIELARGLVADADFVVALAAPGIPWSDIGRVPDLRVLAQIDRVPADARAAACAGADLAVSAVTGEGIAELRAAIRDRLVPKDDRLSQRPWIFDPRLAPA